MGKHSIYPRFSLINAKKDDFFIYKSCKKLKKIRKGQKVKLAEFEIDYRKISKQELIFRIMTYEHIPDEPGRKKNPKTEADKKVRLNFPPFMHYKFNENDELICVGKSHWQGGMENGYFSKDQYKIYYLNTTLMMSDFTMRQNAFGFGFHHTYTI